MVAIAINRRERMGINLLGCGSGATLDSVADAEPRKLTVGGVRKGHECLMYATGKDSAKSVRTPTLPRAQVSPGSARLGGSGGLALAWRRKCYW
jgi:hypothetical protein